MKYSDIDFELVLSSFEIDDYAQIQQIIKTEKIRVECQLRYFDELTNPDGLIKKTNYKIFMYFAYANGLCLLGENIYKNLIKTLADDDVKKSLLLSAHIAFKDIRKSYLSNSSQVVINKQIKIFVLDLLMFLGYLDYRDLGKVTFMGKGSVFFVEELKDACPTILTGQNLIIYKKFRENSSNKILCCEMFSITNKIYQYFFSENEIRR